MRSLHRPSLAVIITLGALLGGTAHAYAIPASKLPSDADADAPGTAQQEVAARQGTEVLVPLTDVPGADSSGDVTTGDILGGFFDRVGCAVPRRMAKRLRRINKGKPWVPSDASYEFQDVLGAKLSRLEEGASIRATLHRVKIGKNWKAIAGAASYSRLNPFEFLDLEYTNFTYSMDCSGFLNAALAAGVGVSAASLKSSAEIALRTQRSYLLLRATLFGPISAALRPRSSPEGLSASETDRMDTLWALLAEAGETKDDVDIEVMHRIQVVGTSRQGSSSMQGRAALSGDASASAGFGSVSLSASSGLTQGRQVNYQTFATYLLGRPISLKVKLAEVRGVMKQLVARAANVEAPSEVNGNLVVRKALPSRLCREEWVSTAAQHKIRAEYQEGACVMTVRPKPPAEGVVAKIVNGLGNGQDLELSLAAE